MTTKITSDDFSYDSAKGLNIDQVKNLRQKYGMNLLTPPKKNPWWKELLDKFKDPTIQILLVAAVISLLITTFEKYVLKNEESGYVESIGIFLAVGLATLVGYFSERKSAREFELLNKVKEDITIKALRAGQITNVQIGDLVVGDIVRLDRGDKVPADGALIDSLGLFIDESMLTGESVPAKKQHVTGEVKLEELMESVQIKDDCFVARGTMVADGNGLFLITAVGDKTQMGAIAQALGDEGEGKNETPLTAKLSRLAQQISVIGVSAALAIFSVMSIIATWNAFLPKDVQNELSSTELYALLLAAVVFGFVLMRYVLKPFFASMDMPVTSKVVSLICLIPMFIAAFSLAAGIWMMVSMSTPDAGVNLLQEVLLAFVISVTIIVVAVPEGLPMMVTVSLALNMMKMARENCLVRKLVASETIGSATVICTDKTGTLTQNQMKPVRILLGKSDYNIDNFDTLPQNADWQVLVEGIAVNSNANLHIENADDSEQRKVTGIGNPTECSLLKFLDSLKMDYITLREKFPLLWEVPHNSDRKLSAAMINGDNGKKCHIKGAPERIISKCSTILIDGKIEPIDSYSGQINAAIRLASDEALRVIAFSFKTLDTDSCCDACSLSDPTKCLTCSGQTFVGLVGIADPIRREAAGAVQTCSGAGVQVKMITGDALPTAVAIARQANIYQDTENELVLTSEDFGKISDEDLPEAAQKIRVLARSTPMDKLRLVKALHHQGEVVAMTGDGTNDAPSLKYADVGLAMGITGTEVAKEASDIILVDDNFKSIVTGICWGRTLFQNIQRFLQFQLSVNFVALLCAFIGPLVGIPLPLTVTQLLWINIIMDTFAAIAYSMDPPRKYTMKQKPIQRESHIITPTMGLSVLIVSLYQVAFLFATIFRGWFVDPEHVYDRSISPLAPEYLEHNLQSLTVFFTVLVMFQFWHKFNCRALHHSESPFTLIWKNKLFIMIIVSITVIQIFMVQSEIIGEFFRTTPLSLRQWLQISGATASVLVVAWIARQITWMLGGDKT